MPVSKLNLRRLNNLYSKYLVSMFCCLSFVLQFILGKKLELSQNKKLRVCVHIVLRQT